MATVAEERPSSSTSSFNEEEVNKLMSQGKRHFVCNEVVEAVKSFQEACRLLGEKYGQTANECGDAYHHYGKSLLELARVENGVLGNALKEVPVDESDSDEETKLNTVGPKIKDIPLEEKEALKERVQSAMEKKETSDKGEESDEAKTKEEKEASGSGENKDSLAEVKEAEKECSEEKDAVDESKSVAEGEGADDETAGAKEGESAEKENKDGDEDEAMDGDGVPTIQLAWEMLELARIIFKRMNNQDSQLKLAQTHSMLGEINMEQEQFTDAISELTKCLSIQKALLQPDDRLLAETYYNLGLAYGLSLNYEESAKHYSSASEVLELRIKNIKDRMEKEEQQDKGKGKASDNDPYVKDRKELAELEELLPEIKDKYYDAKNEHERLKNNIKNQLGFTPMGFGDSSSAVTSNSSVQSVEPKKADDISHLVRRAKRKPEQEEQTEQDNVPPKKQRQDEDTTALAENSDRCTSEKAVTEPK